MFKVKLPANDMIMNPDFNALQVIRGEDGFSPLVDVEEVEEGYVLTITDKDNTDTILVKHGTNGVDGHDGAVGPQGPVGPQGAKGDRGERGYTGEMGPVGPRGEKGDRGDTGIQGPKGEKGDKGDQGERGATGAQGPRGYTGNTGDRGPQGPQGPQGPRGLQGLPGKDHSAEIDNHEHRIINIERHIENKYFVRDELTGTFYVPENICPYVQINKVGGMSYQTAINLFDIYYVDGGLIKSDGRIEVQISGPDWGESTTENYFGLSANLLLEPDKEYYFSVDMNNISLEPQSDTWFEDLQLCLVDEYENEYACIKPNQSFYVTDWIYKAYINTTIYSDFAGSKSGILNFVVNEGDAPANSDAPFMITKSAIHAVNSYYSGEPYIEYYFYIPEPIRSLEGYGYGINKEYYNYIDLDKKEFVQYVGKLVIKGTESWKKSSSPNNMYYLDYVLGLPSKEVLCTHYKSNEKSGQTIDKNIWISSTGKLNVTEYEIGDLVSWKNHLSALYQQGTPLTVYYIRQEPIITDISTYLTESAFVEVAGGGKIAPVDDQHEDIAAPMTLTYLLKEGSI